MPSPYLPISDADRGTMLKEIGAASIDDLFKDIPADVRDVKFNLPEPQAELELKKELLALARKNVNAVDQVSFLGGGVYNHYIPSVVSHITSKSEFYTAYTPYQPEVSQATLQTVYEYQSMICQLTGMDVSNAGMYDGSTSAAEAAVMAMMSTKKSKTAILSTVNPGFRDVIDTYVKARGMQTATLEAGNGQIEDGTGCLIIQTPNFYGYFEDEVEMYAKKIHEIGGLLVIIFDPVSLGIFKTPADYGADIAVAEGQPLGLSLSLGGPYLGIFACNQKFIRTMPGRLVGKTTDADGNPGYVMTFVTREQYIRREKSISNICTSEGLMTTAAAVYLAAMGKTGMQKVAKLCYDKAHYAANAISRLKGYSLAFDKPFFKEFAVKCPVEPRVINEALLKENIIGGLDISKSVHNGMLLCVTEMNSRDEIDKLVGILGKI